MKNLKITIAVLILLFINLLFSYKYISRYTGWGVYVSLALFIFQFAVYWYNESIILSIKTKQLILFGVFSLIIILITVSHFKIPVEGLNVDRWSVISAFFTEFFNGNYPYFAKSHMGNYPGPMPMYFLFALPFYQLGELSILSGLGYLVFIILIMKKNNLHKKNAFLIIYLGTSFFLVWEIVVRSNIFTYTMLTLLVLNEFVSLKDRKNLKFYLFAILTGVCLSTRSVYILPYIIFFISSLINNEVSFKNIVLYLSVAFITFISTFLPFIIYYNNDFFTMNPFIVQSSFLIPMSYTLLFILFSILFAFMVKNNSEKTFYSGLSLFISILIYSIYHLVNYGYIEAFLNSRIDISYFIFSTPFLLFYLLENMDREEQLIKENI